LAPNNPNYKLYTKQSQLLMLIILPLPVLPCRTKLHSSKTDQQPFHHSWEKNSGV